MDKYSTRRNFIKQGGLLIWSFPTVIDAFSTKIGGAKAEQTQFPTWRFENLWLK